MYNLIDVFYVSRLNDICWRIKIKKLFNTQFQLPSHNFLLGTNILNILFSTILDLFLSHWWEVKSIHAKNF
jgi:hypothetical protein